MSTPRERIQAFIGELLSNAKTHLATGRGILELAREEATLAAKLAALLPSSTDEACQDVVDEWDADEKKEKPN